MTRKDFEVMEALRAIYNDGCPADSQLPPPEVQLRAELKRATDPEQIRTIKREIRDVERFLRTAKHSAGNR